MAVPQQHGQSVDNALNARTALEGIAVGLVYGLTLRLLMLGDNAKVPGGGLPVVLSIGFLVIGPLALGFMVVRRASRAGRTPVVFWLLAPWISTVLMMLATAALLLEGWICIVMALPIALIMSSVGGVAAGLLYRQQRGGTMTTACVALLPLLMATSEGMLTAPTQTRTVSSQIRIHATVHTVWINIQRVPAISAAELRPNWTHRIGFPRPVEATLSYEGVGGVRHATFEHGVLFVETVNGWDPDHRLAFSIRADNANIPPTTLDQHVTIGGRYFDVLDGEYKLEPASNGDVILHLTSHQRLSTDLNGYAGLWTDAVMQSLQTSILEVVQHRCERA